MREPLQFVPVALIPEIRLRPTERETIRIVATLEWIARQWIAVGSQHFRPLRLVGIEGTHHEEPALVIAPFLGEPLQLVSAPPGLKVERRHDHDQQGRALNLGPQAVREGLVAIKSGIHPNFDAALRILGSKQDVEMTTKGIDKGLRPAADEVVAPAAVPIECLGTVCIAHKGIVLEISEIWHLATALQIEADGQAQEIKVSFERLPSVRVAV